MPGSTDSKVSRKYKKNLAREPLPWRILFPAYLIQVRLAYSIKIGLTCPFFQINEAVGSMIFAPFLPGMCCPVMALASSEPCRLGMVRTKFNIGEEFVGTASGVLLGSISLSRFFGSFFMGYGSIADKWGSRFKRPSFRYLSDRFGRKLLIQFSVS